ncbi:GntR family transcriptional regulator [Saccharopolyspora hirsuta]|uniref:GntR family transcriptional regulator n=1 Tax=Saccharopolyspora hirsuta TaxID=1837 RepID=A0A5M7BVI9_SACHI|nr:GntR family transcriptional regulator [Saccharopolyspora hirsuta]KAA5831221.1 GntR family transcriptional regulator [Saccharopolyspora hirsuta]
MTASSGNAREALAALDPRLPLHARLREALTTRLRGGEWTPSEPLPAESELAQDYGVSLGTMRRVLTELVDEGLLERRQGSGTYLRRMQAQNSLFRFFRHHRQGDAVPTGRILTRETRPAPAEVARALGKRTGTKALRLHRLRSYDDEPFLVEDIWLPLPAFAPVRDVELTEIGDLLYPVYEQLCGLVIGSADEELWVELADAEVAELLGCAPGEPVVVVERVARTHAGDPVEVRRSRGLASTFRYRVEIR